MLLPSKAVEINTQVRRKFQKHTKIIYPVLIALILLTTLYIVHKHKKHIGSESVKQKWATRNLYENVRIFCLIYILQPSQPDAALKVYKTWARRCNRALFVSSETHDVLEPLIILEPRATPEHQWMRLKLAFGYVHANHLDEAEWFLVADDWNFVVLENLRKLLESYSPNDALSFGCKIKNKDNQTYLHGAYVLSREALRRLINQSYTNASLCNLADSPYANEEMARCLRNVDVSTGDSRDALGRQRFVPYSPGEYVMDLQSDKREPKTKGCCYDDNATTLGLSPEVISFSYVNSKDMVTLYYYIYKLRIFGRNVRNYHKTIHLE